MDLYAPKGPKDPLRIDQVEQGVETLRVGEADENSHRVDPPPAPRKKMSGCQRRMDKRGGMAGTARLEAETTPSTSSTNQTPPTSSTRYRNFPCPINKDGNGGLIKSLTRVPFRIPNHPKGLQGPKTEFGTQ